MNDVLAIQKIEEGVMKLVFKPFAFDSLIRMFVEPFAAELERKNLKLEVVMNDSIPTAVRGDKYRLNHVLSKLLSNAIKHSPMRGQVLININVIGAPYESTVEGYFSNNQTIPTTKNVTLCEYVVKISDQGPGIPEEVLKNIFVPYLSTKPGDVKQGRGSGLGLAICKDVLSLHGGGLTCESVVGNGSCFSLRVPLELADSVTDKNKRRSMSMRNEDFSRSSKEWIETAGSDERLTANETTDLFLGSGSSKENYEILDKRKKTPPRSRASFSSADDDFMKSRTRGKKGVTEKNTAINAGSSSAQSAPVKAPGVTSVLVVDGTFFLNIFFCSLCDTFF